MNIITIIQAALTGLNNTAELFMLEKARAENEELENTTDTIIVYPDWRETNTFNQALELQKTRVYNIDFKTPDEWDNSDDNIPTAYESKTSADRIEDMAVLADSVFSYISAHNNLFPEITQKLKWTSPRPILRANNGTMSGVTVQLTVVFSGERICDYITTPVPVIPFPNPDDLNTWHKTITGNTFAESINNLPAKILPRVADFNGVDDVIQLNSGFTLDRNNATIVLNFNLKSYKIGATYHLLGDVETGIKYLGFFSNVLFRCESNVNAVFWMDSPTIPALNVQNKLIIIANAGTVTSYLNGVLIDTKNPTENLTLSRINNQLAPSESSIYNVQFYDVAKDLSFVTAYQNETTIDQTGLLYEYYPTGQGDYDYDLVNGNHGTWAGTGARFTYDLEGSLYPNGGYSLWIHATLDPIQVPFDINGNPLSLTPGVDIPAGYTWKRDLLPGGINHNIYDSLIDFDPDGLGSAEVAIFDRSNATRQTAASRASIYYDSNFPYRYHISEISDPRIYDTFFNPDFQNIIFGRIVLDSEGNTDIIRYDEELNYKTQREGDTLSENIIYCRFITNIYP